MRRAGKRVRRRGALPLAHGLYMGLTGLWPIFHLRSFEAVTGPKVDRWLVKSTAALVTAVGAALVADGLRGRSARVLGIGSALALGGADVVYAVSGRISRVYLVDAVLQAGFAAAWALRRRRSRAR